jgi:hypothetical protein
MMINRLITLNQTIIQGYNSVSWIPYTLTGSGFIGLLFGNAVIGLVGGTGAFIISSGIYWYIGHTHNVHAKEVMK